VQQAAAHLTELAPAIVEIVDELAGLCADLVETDNARRAALAQAGHRDSYPPAAELAVEVLHGRLGALRPYLPYVTAQSADRAAEALLELRGIKPPRPRRPHDDEL
jgi:hypothetical protein